MRPRGSRSGTGSASLQDDDAWSLSMEESRDAPVIEEMTRQLQLGSSGSTDQQPQRATKSHNPARPHSSRKSSSTSGIWSYLTGRQPSALESIHTETTQPRPGSSAEPRPSSQQGNSSSNTLPTTLQRSQSSRSRASSRSSAGHATGSTWIYLSDKADASSALRGKSVALLNQDEMAAAIRLNLAEILKDPTAAIMRLRVSEQAAFYDAGPNTRPFTISQESDTVTPTASSSKTETSSFEHPPDPSSTTTVSASNRETQDHPSPTDHAALRERRRREKLLDCLVKDSVDLGALRKLAWSGLPDELRPMAWQLLLGYLPAPSARRASVLARKRQDYAEAVKTIFSKGIEDLDQAIWHQIHIDVPRTNPGVPLWQFESTQRALERILYVWAIRHPASGYVQGINDVVTPFFQVFLSQYIDTEPELFDVSHLPEETLEAIEADSFWCLNKLLDGIQDNYVSGQPGIRVKVDRLKELCERVDAPLAAHLKDNHIEFMQFAFKWIHLLLLRVLPIDAVVRMWDTYMSEGSNAFADYHIYVCLAFLLRSSSDLRKMDFQAMMLFFQSPVEHDVWSARDTEVLLSEGFLWKSIFGANR